MVSAGSLHEGLRKGSALHGDPWLRASQSFAVSLSYEVTLAHPHFTSQERKASCLLLQHQGHFLNSDVYWGFRLPETPQSQ